MKNSGKLKSQISLLAGKTLLFLFLSVQVFAQKSQSLARSTPEAQGVSSAAINQFIDAFTQSSHELHSFMIVRHGKVIAEAWNKPYAPDLKHTLYSVSKSFTATAIGFAVSEGKLSVEDQVISFFSDDLPAEVSPNLAKLKIKDLLTMSVGHATEPFSGNKTDNWSKAFLSHPVVYEPGTKFLYNSAATYMLSAIITKVTGQKLIDYLGPRLFEPLGIQGADWETDGSGVNTGGWGLRVKTEDMAKLGQLFLQKGVWQGKQIIPAAWIQDASSLKIEQDPGASAETRASNDWVQGYCYQMWRSRHNSFRADGAYGQYILILPEQDAVVAITAETPDMQSEINLVWKYLLPGFKPSALKSDAQALSQLRKKSADLAIAPAKASTSPLEKQLSGKTIRFEDVNSNIKSMILNFKEGKCQLNLQTSNSSYPLVFGKGKWERGVTDRKGPNLVAGAKANQDGLAPFKVAGSYQWKDDNTLELILRYIESPHTEIIRYTFDDNEASVDFENLFNKSNDNRPKLKGKFVD